MNGPSESVTAALPLGGLTPREEALRKAVLATAPRKFRRLVNAGCDPTLLVFHLSYWAWEPATLLQRLNQERTETTSLRQEIETLGRIAAKLAKQSEQMSYPSMRSAALSAANKLRVAVRSMSHLLPPRMQERDLRTEASLRIIGWVQNNTRKHARHIDTVAGLLKVTAEHYNALNPPEMRIYAPNKKSLQELLRRHRPPRKRTTERS